MYYSSGVTKTDVAIISISNAFKDLDWIWDL